MQIAACENCEKPFEDTPAPCPDGIQGCCMAHYDKSSFICPHCKHDNGPSISKGMLEGPWVELPGIGFGNVAAIKRLDLK